MKEAKETRRHDVCNLSSCIIMLALMVYNHYLHAQAYHLVDHVSRAHETQGHR